MSIRLNSDLFDIGGLSNIKTVKGAKLYIDDTDQYISKPDVSSDFCSDVWDLYDLKNIDDDMRKVCDGYTYAPTDVDKFRDVLGSNCNIDSKTFYATFDDTTGIFDGSIDCSGSNLGDAELQSFKVLLGINGDFSLAQNALTNLDGIIRLQTVNGTMRIDGNPNLNNIFGLSNIEGTDGQTLVIDDSGQYSTKADPSASFCSVTWDLYNSIGNIADDMQQVCAAQ